MMKTLLRILMLAMVVCLAVGQAPAQTQPNPAPLYYTGIVGGDAPAGRRVLLRWYTLEQLIDLESAVIFRTGNDGVRQKVATVRRTRSAAVIKGVFFRPGEQRILNEARGALERIYGTSGQSEDEFAQLCVDLLEGRDATDYADARRNFLTQINYGFAIVEGLGYLDFVNPAQGPFVYELWQGDAAGTPLAALGKITIDATTPMFLPPPADLREVFLIGRDGQTPARANHRRIFLDWDLSPELLEKRDLSFGYHIYKLDRPLIGGETFETVKNQLVRVNEFPILPPSPIPDEDATQSYIFADDGGWLDSEDENDLLPVGETYTYWAVAIDLLGNEGSPSNALEATVRDTFEPNTPRGMNVVPERDENDVPLLRVYFDRQDEDTETYRLYRFQLYENQGKTGPFPNVNGLTEGRITVLNQPADPNNRRIVFDDYAPGTTEPGRVFWYCVSAVDIHGNESPMSPPARGVIDDVVPPMLDGILDICGARPLPFVRGTATMEGQESRETWNPIFKFDKSTRLYAEVRVSRVPPSIPGVPAERPTVIEVLPLTSIGTQYASDEDDRVNNGREAPVYEFEAVAFDGSVTSVRVDPPTDWVPGGPRVCYEISLESRGVEENCVGPNSANDPQQFIVIPGGNTPPLKIKTACPGGDIEGYRLYRSVDGGRSYTFIREFYCVGQPTLDLVDDYHPEGLAQVKYSVAPFDKHGNIGIPYVLPGDFVVVGDVPRPTVLEVIASGNDIPAQRSVTVKWTGPRQGISHYNVRIVRKGDLNAIATPPLPLEFALSDVNEGGAPGNFSWDANNNEYSITTRDIDRSGNDFDPNAQYLVSVAAVPKAGAAASSTNQLPLIWASKKLAGGGVLGELRWAARPMPEFVGPSGMTIFSNQNVRGGSVLISVRAEPSEFPDFDIVEPPFIVWRRRSDLPQVQWHAVSPVIEEIRRTGEGVINDPFFHKQFQTVYFVDNSGHVPFRPYAYLILKLNKKTFEIERVLGPLEVEVEITPQ